MIRSYEEYQFYLKQDRIALGIRQEGWTGKLKQWLLPDPIWKFERLMRRCEYLTNCGGKRNPMLLWYRVRYRKLSLKLGFSIPINTFGPGLSIVHYGTIVVNSAARIGKNCRLHACVNIGASRGSKMAAQIGDNVYIGPSVVIFGDIRIADNVTIGANATVNRDCREENAVLAGTPAVVVKSDFPVGWRLNGLDLEE